MLNQTRVWIPERLVKLFMTIDDNPKILDRLGLEYAKITINTFGNQNVLSHDNYLNTFSLSKNAPSLMKIYNITQKDLVYIFMKLHTQKESSSEKDVYTEEGFMSHRMYTEPEYLVHLLIIIYGVYRFGKQKIDDNAKSISSEHGKIYNLMKMAILLIYARLYNGRIAKYYPKHKDYDVARYIQKIVLPKTFLLRKYSTPSEVLMKHYLPEAMRYLNSKDLNQQPENIIYMFSQFWNKINSLFRRITDVYLETFREGKKLSATDALRMKQNDEGRDIGLVERFGTLRNDIKDRVNELEMIINMTPENKVPSGLLDKYIVTPYLFTPSELIVIYNGFINPNNLEKITEIYSKTLVYFANHSKTHSIGTMCDKIGILERYINKLLKSKRDQTAIQIKNMIDDVMGTFINEDMGKMNNRMRVSYYRRVFFYIMSLMLMGTCNRSIRYTEI